MQGYQVAPKIVAMFEVMTRAELDAMPPARRRQFADVCRHWANIADKSLEPPPPKSGVLAELRDGRPD